MTAVQLIGDQDCPMEKQDGGNVIPDDHEDGSGGLGRDRLLLTFYTVPRLGQEQLSDGGGPFGFDITTALQVDSVLKAYGCDGIVETGCFLGDTTDYLSRMYPHLPVRTCDVESLHAGFTRNRLKDRKNVTVVTGDSGVCLSRLLDGLAKPLVYLDAHWNTSWPLSRELGQIPCGVVAIDDFDIAHPRFGFDSYDGQACGPGLVAAALPDLREMFVGNPHADYGVPVLQTGRRSGTGYLPRALSSAPLARSRKFVRVPVRPDIIMPPWDVYMPPRPEHLGDVR